MVYGYKKSPDDKNKLILDEKVASIVRQIFKWKIRGMSGARIAEKLNELGISTPMEYKHISGKISSAVSAGRQPLSGRQTVSIIFCGMRHTQVSFCRGRHHPPQL